VIEFYNPHVDDFLGEPPHFRLLRRRALKKYGYLIEAVLAEEGEVRLCVDATSSAFVPENIFGRLPWPLRHLIAALELREWLRLNDLRGKVRVSREPDLSGQRALLFMSYKGATGLLAARRTALAQAPLPIAHLSHYFISTAAKAENLERFHQVVLAGDADFSANPYFEHFFSWYEKPVIALPFTVAERFRSLRPWSERSPKALATGTFHDLTREEPRCKYEDYMGFFGIPTYHPVRKLIFENADTLRGEIETHISPFRSSRPNTGRFGRLKAAFGVSQKSYFAVDIVELYNRHRYAIVGEEATGAPALGAFEAMACGSVLIADPRFYIGWDMKPGIHFVAHDGSLDSIRAAIRNLNADPMAAQAIAEEGRAYIDRTFRPRPAYAAVKAKISRLLADRALT